MDDSQLDRLVQDAVFGSDARVRDESRSAIRQMASARGVFPASIQALYEAAGRGLCEGVSVPAINIRGMTYMVARSVFRAAQKDDVGAFIFEIARSEMGYTRQRPAEYAACILAAAIREGHRGPVFIQGDHFQIDRDLYGSEPEKEMGAIKELIREAVDAGFLNIDIDASTLVDLDRPTLAEQQERNCRVTAEMTRLIRSIQPEGTTISIGGEIGEIGKGNSTAEDLRAFMSGYRQMLGRGVTGISKISVQTGTSHGGVVLPDGSIAEVQLDFETLAELSRIAREECGLAGAVQHGASTLPDEAFRMFPQAGAIEVHLATGFQNTIYDSPFFPRGLLDDIKGHLAREYASERKQGETEEQFLYKTRKRAFGDFKKEMWGLPVESLEGIGDALGDRFSLIFRELNVVGTAGLVARFITSPSL